MSYEQPKDLDDVYNVLDDFRGTMPNEKERRRYALLQAATQIYVMYIMKDIDDPSHGAAIGEAEILLREIENREKRKAK